MHQDAILGLRCSFPRLAFCQLGRARALEKNASSPSPAKGEDIILKFPEIPLHQDWAMLRRSWRGQRRLRLRKAPL